jgi:hypothetical protein
MDEPVVYPFWIDQSYIRNILRNIDESYQVFSSGFLLKLQVENNISILAGEIQFGCSSLEIGDG